MFHEEHCSPPSDSPTLEATRVAICRDVPQRVSFSSFGIESSCYLLLSFKMKGEFCISLLYKYYTLIYKIRLDYAQHVLPVCDVRTHREYWGYLFTRSLCDSCTSERFIESVSYEAFSALESTSTRSDFWNSNEPGGTTHPCLFPQSSLTMFWNDDVLTYSRPPEFIRHGVLFALES